MALRKKKFDFNRISKLSSNKKYFDNCRISQEVLKCIYDDYVSVEGDLEKTKNEIVSLLNERLPQTVHSLRGRVKEPDHLIEKVVRNNRKNPEKYAEISEDNYNKIVTDLIGIRIIIVDKRDWRSVHESLLELFHNDPEKYIKGKNGYIENYDKYKDYAENGDNYLERSYHAEMPVVYITTNDDRMIYQDENLKVDESKMSQQAYRSIHYIIRYGTVFFEIQVRTIFEEGWLEFDHRCNYPYDLSNRKKREFTSILGALAQASDRLIAFYDESYFVEDNEYTEEKVESEPIKEDKKEGKTFKEKLVERF